MLPELVGPYGVLPVGVHRATLAEVRERFVEQAPKATRRRRRWICDALELHMEVMLRALRGEPVRVWLDGGFTTHKERIPEDIDVLYLTSRVGFQRCWHEKALPLLTLTDVSARAGRQAVETDKLHSMGGLVDGYAGVDNEGNRDYWRDWFSHFKDANGAPVPGVEKGILEVILDD